MVRYGILAVVVSGLTVFPARGQESARVVRVQPVVDVIRNGQKGMLIQLDSHLIGLQNRPVLLRALFYAGNGKGLLARPGFYSAPTGQVGAPVEVTPAFPVTAVQNTELFIPYDELSQGIPGVHRLSFRVEVWHRNAGNWVCLDQLGHVQFVLIQQ